LQLFEQIEELEVSERFGSSDSKKVLRDFTESLLWHDKMSPAVFDHIMERDVMGTLVRIFANSGLPFTAKLYIIQSVTMLLLNLSRITSIFLVCSNNHLNVMISVDLQDGTCELIVSTMGQLVVSIPFEPSDGRFSMSGFTIAPAPMFFVGFADFWGSGRAGMVMASLHSVLVAHRPRSVLKEKAMLLLRLLGNHHGKRAEAESVET